MENRAIPPTDYRTVFLNYFGRALSVIPDKNIVGISRSMVDRDIAVVTVRDIVRDVDYTIEVDISGDSEWQAMKDIIAALE